MNNMTTKITSLFTTKKSKIVATLLAIMLITGGTVAISNTVSANEVWAVLLNFFGKANVTGDVAQSVLLDDGRYSITGDDGRIQSSEVDLIFGGETSQSNHTLENRSSVEQNVELGVTYTPARIESAITTSYLESVDYSYTKNILGVDVSVTDEGEWLKWTYTPTGDGVISAMTVAINHDTEDVFEIWTDDGHGWADGFSYGDSSDPTTVVDASSVDGIIVSEWSVSIRKDLLGSAFTWIGNTNYNGNTVWINANETGIGYGEPKFEVTIRKDLGNSVILQPNEALDFIMSNKTDGYLVCNNCMVTLTVEPR